MKMTKKVDKCYCFVFTWNNYTEDSCDVVKALSDKALYTIVGKEVAPTTGTPHLQGFFQFKNARSKDALRKKMKGAYVESAVASASKNKEYCEKDNIWLEMGTPPQQGRRTDLLDIKDEIMNGMKVDDICLREPETYHQYGRTLEKIQLIYDRKKYRNWKTECKWYVGPTGVGKSHKVFEDFNPETHYILVDDNGWWDGYCGQDIIIINDFRGFIKFEDMLVLADKWPHMVKKRNVGQVPFLSKEIRITSVLKPCEVYSFNIGNDSIAQLERRIEVINLA